MSPLSLCCLVFSCFSYLLLSGDGNVIYLSNGIQNDRNTVAFILNLVCRLPSVSMSHNTIALHTPDAIMAPWPVRGFSYSNLSWISKSFYSKLFLSMYIIYKKHACYCVTRFLIGLKPSVDLFGSKLSEGCCVVSNHFSIYSHIVMNKH